jgi:DNA mismatch endonuclease, patch repair protein
MASVSRRMATTPETSARMKKIRRERTEPENVVGTMLTSLGLRFRRCVRGLPGTPDFANRTRGWAIFVNGCFWHGHIGCRAGRLPKTNAEFWNEKIAANRARDATKRRLLRGRGLLVITVWQCELRRPGPLERKLRRLLCGR